MLHYIKRTAPKLHRYKQPQLFDAFEKMSNFLKMFGKFE